ncbi:MAG TPA: aminotransferase class III-fold pyridoxal phosphate-dependent enzyme, partial [Oscillospiraceae bacterium]|nr:aminotransferase class III-fold pyridoxal phosphate-dependent enzyme [Oscillospiraceae bacterium]
MDIRELDKQYIADTYARYPVTLLCGKGALAYDDKGKEYIDMGAGIGVNAFGYADPVWLSAVIEQASTLQHVSNLYYTAPAPKLAELLCQKTGMKKAFFCNSGAEANECLLKA